MLENAEPARRQHLLLLILLVAAGLYSGLTVVLAAEPDLAPPVVAPVTGSRAHFARRFDVARFQRGNIHAHSTLSDGANTPAQTILWYKTHGYQFLALTDHNVLSRPERYAGLQEPHFVLLSGEEITMTGSGRPVHVNALCTRTHIPGGAFATVSLALGSAIHQIKAQNGIAIVNHPNFDWALSPGDVIDARDAALLEIASGHPHVRAAGDEAHPSHEALWDQALTAGAHYMGVAVDDVHRVNVSGHPLALPGKAWIEVFGERGDAEAICAGLAVGDLYSSTGVKLRRVAVTEREYIVEPTEQGVTVTFIGNGGEALGRVLPNTASVAIYSLKGNEIYVRARVDNADGQQAWTPAVRVKR